MQFVETSGKGFALVLALLLSRDDAIRERQLAPGSQRIPPTS